MAMFPCLLSGLLLILSVPSQAQTIKTHNITLGSSLTSAGTDTSWLSPSGEFAFGFRALEGNASAFLLAIWFVNTADYTTAWYANGDTPALTGSTLQFTSFGLSLKDPSGQDAAEDMRRIERFVKVALWCIQEEPSLRPNMLKVTQMLNGAVDIPVPPDPCSYISTIQ